MGNKPPSAPCFQDQIVASALSWAHKNDENCTNLFGNNCVDNHHEESIPEAEHDTAGDEENSLQTTKTITSQQQQPQATPLLLSRLAPDLPALTDNMSSSEQELSEHLDAAAAAADHDEGALQGSPTNQSEFLYQNYTSGSIERDARIDLGTSRCSTGGRDDQSYFTSYLSGSIDRDARIDLGTSRGSSGGRDDRDDHEGRHDQSREEW
jgi:hypothetical protein